VLLRGGRAALIRLPDRGAQAGLVAFHGEHVAGAGGVQQGGGGVLGVQRVGGEQHARRVVPGGPQILDQHCEHGDLVGLGGDLALRQHHRWQLLGR